MSAEYVRGMREYHPGKKWNHRYTKIHSLNPIDLCITKVECQSNNNQLIDTIGKWCNYGTHSSKFITRYQYTDSRNLIENPSYHIRFCFSYNNRMHISKWWCKYQNCWDPCHDLMPWKSDSLCEKIHMYIVWYYSSIIVFLLQKRLFFIYLIHS